MLEVARTGTLARSATSPPARLREEAYVPMMAVTLSRSARRFTALAASTLSDLLSTTTSSTGRPRTVGVILCASWMPSSSSCPAKAFCPVRGM